MFRSIGVSVYMVVRLFDQGVLTGWKNPATNWRMIDRESVEALAKKGMEAWPRKGRPRKTWAVVRVKQKEG